MGSVLFLSAKNADVTKSTFLAPLLLSVALAGLFIGCGGNDRNGSHVPPPNGSHVPPPSNLIYAQAIILATAGTAISPNTPTVVGTVSKWSASPTLPVGLGLNPQNGAISGTPTAPSPQTSYVITASNESGSTTATIQIKVASIPPSNLVYPQTTINGAVGTAITPDVPSVNGTVTSYSINPALPAGLALDSTSGTISGVPQKSTAQAAYTVTAANDGGSTTAILTISIVQTSTLLVELGHAEPIVALRMTSDRVLSQDLSGHWVLWDYGSASKIVDGDGAVIRDSGSPVRAQIDLIGQSAVIGTASELQVISSTDGHRLSAIPFPAESNSWWKLASDGTYIATGDTSSLTVWTTAGLKQFTRSGDYHYASAFAAPGQIEIANGPAGAQVIETVSVPGGASSIGPSFLGTFNTWFTDGQRFISTLSTSIWIYSNSSALQAYMTLPQSRAALGLQHIAGQGGWISFVGYVTDGTAAPTSNQLQIYAIGASSPSLTVEAGPGFDQQFFPANTMLCGGGSDDSSSSAYLIDLSGTSPILTRTPIPSSVGGVCWANSTAKWVSGNDQGVIYDGGSPTDSPRYFGYGRATAIAGGGSVTAIATASGPILVYDVTKPTLVGNVNFVSGKLALSADGTVVGASATQAYAQYVPDRTLNFYSIPSLATISSFPYTYDLNGGLPFLGDFSLSGSGTTMAQVLYTYNAERFDSSRIVAPISGSPLIWSDAGSNAHISLSPDGTLFATTSGGVTNIYKEGALVTGVPGDSEGWIDNHRILVANYVPIPKGAGTYRLDHHTIYDSAGTLIATIPNLPPLLDPQVLPPDSVYDPVTNGIYSLTTGTEIWQGPSSGGVGAAAGQYIVYAAGHQVLLLSH